jgi:hypothetical protein
MTKSPSAVVDVEAFANGVVVFLVLRSSSLLMTKSPSAVVVEVVAS